MEGRKNAPRQISRRKRMRGLSMSILKGKIRREHVSRILTRVAMTVKGGARVQWNEITSDEVTNW